MGFLSSLFGIKGSQPKTSTVVQAQKLPEEISPFVREILGEAQDLYKAEIERGYDPYTGETIAPLTAEEEAAMAGIAGLAGITTPFLEEAVETYRTGAEKFTPEAAEEYMSPYQRAVTDIEKREAERTFERDTMPRFEASAVQAGGLSGLGSRAGIQAAELQRNQNILLADIEAKGQQQAFQDARMGFEAQKARERQMAGDVGKIGPAMFQAGLAEQGALQTVGEQKRGLGQSALDEAYYRFLEEKQFPQKTLSDYSGMVYANPMAGLTTQTDTTTGTPFVPSKGQQIMGMGLAGLNVFGMGGGFNPGGFNPANIWQNKAEGGPVIGRARGGQTGIWNDDQAEYKETPSGLKLMMKGSDGRYYTKGGEDQRGLYYPEEVREEIEVESSDEITDGGPPPTQPSPLQQELPPIPQPSPLQQPLYQDPAGMRIPSRKDFGMNAFNVDQKKIDDLLSQMPWLQNRLSSKLGSIVPGRKPSVPLTDDPIRQVLTPAEEAAQQQALNDQYWNTIYAQEQLRDYKDTTDPGTGPGWGGLTGGGSDPGNVGYFFKHGGGLNQLANGGPVIYRATPGQTRVGPRGVRQRVQPMVHGYPASQALAGPPSLRGGHPAGRAAHKQQLAAYNKMQQDIMAKQKANPIDMYGTASPGGGGLTGLPQVKPLGQSPGRMIAQHGQQGAFATTLPGGGAGAGGGAGGPIDITDTVTQTIQRLGQNFLAPRESLSSRVAAVQKRLGETEGFSKTKMTESFIDYQTKLKTLQKRMNAKNKAKRAEFNEADKKASEEFFAAQEKAIKAGNNADIIAGAMDTANQRQIKQGGGTIAQWLTDIMNVGVKGIGTRRKEQGKELRELAKEKYKEARSDRKTNRGEELAEINKESLQDAKLLVDKYGFSKELANMDRATRTAAYAEIAAMAADERAELTQVEMMAKLLDVLGKGKKGAGKQEKFTSELKIITARVADRYGYKIDEATGSIKVDDDTFLTASDPNFQKIKDEVDADWRTFLNKQDPSNTTVQGFLSILGPAGSQPASSATVPPNTGNYPVLQSGQTGFKKNDIYYSPKVGPVIWTGTGFKPVTS